MVRAMSCLVLLTMLSSGGDAEAVWIADSVAEFSGTQGSENWYYGYVEPTTSPDFIEMTHWEGGSGGEAGIWTADPELYWTTLYAGGGHGNGLDTIGGRTQVEHWAVRRWISEVEGPITITGTIGKILPGGNGVVGRILVDETTVWSQFVGSDDLDGFDYLFSTNVQQGSTVDFVLDPFEANAVSDDTRFTATVGAIPEPSTLILLTSAAAGLLACLIRKRRQAA